jgi:hypothetical protein
MEKHGIRVEARVVVAPEAPSYPASSGGFTERNAR